MTLSKRKAIVGLTITIVALIVAVPLAFAAVSVLLDRVLGFEPLPDSALVLILTATWLLIGVFWMTWAYSYLVFVGRGLPLEAFGIALHPTKYLVTSGPYAYVRNPGVIGLLFLLLGVAFLTRSVAGIILVPIVGILVVLYIKIFEEKELSRRFGQDYENYRASVPMLVPRLTPYTEEPVDESASHTAG